MDVFIVTLLFVLAYVILICADDGMWWDKHD